MSLERLLEQATPGPWWHRVEVGDEWWFGKGKQATIRTDQREFDSLAVMACDTDEELAVARLVALAPDMAQLLIDMANALAYVSDDWRDRVGIEHPAVLLTRFAELNARAGADGA